MTRGKRKLGKTSREVSQDEWGRCLKTSGEVKTQDEHAPVSHFEAGGVVQ